MMSVSSDDEPIAAVASGSGPGALGIIRVSGKGVWGIISPCFNFKQTQSDPQEKVLARRSFCNPASGQILDDVMVARFISPRSFTGEDTVEIYCHGGPYIVSEILTTIFAQGVRSAKPGEFTKRALLNGKLDLIAAEGIKTLVEAQSRQQWLSGRQLYGGTLREEIDSLRSSLIEAMAWLEAMIDFPDEGDTQRVHLENVKARVLTVEQKIMNLKGTFRSGHIANEGMMVALVGAPNAGKSTLFNTLLGKNRAIVNEVAGTTRDYLEEKCLINGRLIRLVDMAGIRETSDVVEQAGVLISKKLIGDCDVIVALFPSDGSTFERDTMNAIFSEHPDKKIVRVLTKSDLGSPSWAQGMCQVSCNSKDGVADLKNILQGIVDSHIHGIEDSAFITSTRQLHCLEEALRAISGFWLGFNKNVGHELLAFELQEAARALTAVIGDLSNEDVLDKVFSDFCIGK
jgi:tRNA modification GTPase